MATVNNTTGSNGLATGVAAGSAAIKATSGGVSGSTTLNVTAATLVSIGITPSNPSMAKGTTLQFTATGIFSDNTSQDLTTQVTWSSSNTAFATIGTSGLATSVNPGSPTITATLGGKSGSTLLTVTPATLASVEVTPTNPTIAKGTTRQFKATGIFSDSTKQDLTASAAWSSSDGTVASISSAGLSTGIKAGTTTITASFGGKSGTATLTVTAATLAAIEVTPLNPSIALGTSQQFAAIGTFTDNTTQDLTADVTWISSNTGVATISNATGSNGLATSSAKGSTTITAALGGVSGSTLLTVTDAVLVSIDVEPAIPSMPAGLHQQFTATGTFSDNTVQEMTSAVTWSSSDTAVATISNAPGSNGVALTIIPGTATITASFGAVSGSTLLTVTSATLVSIEVTPPNPAIPLGLSQQFTATGIYSDDSVFDLTAEVTWSSSDPTIATVSNDAGSAGLATTVKAGTTTITATLGLVSGSTTLTVKQATLASIAVTPASSSIAIGTTRQFNAIGTYSDSSTLDITKFVTWSSTAPTVAVISNAGNQKGVATGVGAGSTTIRAALGSVVSSGATLTVTNATLQAITITPVDKTIALKTTQQFTATGNFSDGSTQDLSAQVTWSSSNTGVAVISNATVSKGLATSVGIGGPITITATFGGKSGSTTLTVVNAALTGIEVTPANATIAVGASQQFTATGTFEFGIVQDLTKSVRWSSSNKNVASISNGRGTRGLAKAAGAGTTTITATKPATVISGSTTLTVTP